MEKRSISVQTAGTTLPRLDGHRVYGFDELAEAISEV